MWFKRHEFHFSEKCFYLFPASLLFTTIALIPHHFEMVPVDLKQIFNIKTLSIMASIASAVLSISHDHTKKTATPVVKTVIRFSELELCQMRACRGRWFKLKCELWSKDTLFNDPLRPFDSTDDRLFTYSDVHFFPDANPAASESRAFQVTVGEGLLNEDFGTDEIYAIVRLYNLTTGQLISKKSNVVSHSF